VSSLSLSLSLSLLTAFCTNQPAYSLADSDLDGLDDTFELTIGTLPNNPDTDGDGFNDGIESANPGTSNPLTSDSPEFRQVLYDFTNVQESVNQNDSLHRLMPVFNPLDGLSFAYIVAGAPGYTNPRIAIATVGDLSSETFITNPGDLPSPFNFHQLTYKSDGTAVLFDNDKDIFAAEASGGGVAQLTQMNATSFVYNPEVVKIDGADWILAGARDGTITALVAWQYATNPINGDELTTVVNFDDAFNGQEDYPRVSYDSERFSFMVHDKNDITIVRRFIAKGLLSIVNGLTTSISNSNASEPRASNGNFGDYNIPGAVGMIGNFSIFTSDINGIYNMDDAGNFLVSDFNVVSGGLTNILNDSSKIASFSLSVIPFPGNQPFASLDKNGTKVILCSDFNPFLPGKTEFSLLDMSLGVDVKVNDGVTSGGDLFVVDPSGTKLKLTVGDQVDIPDGMPARIKVSTPRIQSTSDVVNIRTFEPSGTTFPGVVGGLQLTYTYRDEDILGLDELTLKIAAWDPVSGAAVILPTTVDAVNNTLESLITHFSSYAIKGNKIVPASVENWGLYDMEGNRGEGD
jgi:hypothetical protein